MNITLSLPDDLVKRVRKIAVDRDTTLTQLVREYLAAVAASSDSVVAERKRREQAALERTFKNYQFTLGKRTWKRQDLYDRN
jgi:predicted transcriptional regulator